MTDSPLLDVAAMARELRIPVERVHEMAHRQRLPFSFLTGRGLVIHRRDLPQWKASVARADCCDE